MNYAANTSPFISLESCAPCYPADLEPAGVNENDPAYLTMTDFRVTLPVTIAATVKIDSALRKMIDVGVRLLLVTDARDCIVGGITSYDIQGEKPVQYAAKARISHNEILVGMIMTPLVQMPVFDFDFVQRARIRDIIDAMCKKGRQHALVIKYEADSGAQTIRGLFSTTWISRMLGLDIIDGPCKGQSPGGTA